MQKKKGNAWGWIIAIIVWCGLWKLADYQIDMYYSKVAPEQFENDAAYSVLRTHNLASNILLVLSIIVILFFLNKIRKIWFPQEESL